MATGEPTCRYCSGARLVGWSGAGPILCPECSHGKDAFHVITQAWRELALGEVTRLKAEVEEGHCSSCEAPAVGDGVEDIMAENTALKAEVERLRAEASKREEDALALIMEFRRRAERPMTTREKKLRGYYLGMMAGVRALMGWLDEEGHRKQA